MNETGNDQYAGSWMISDLLERHSTKPCIEQIVADILGHLSTPNTVFGHLMLL